MISDIPEEYSNLKLNIHVKNVMESSVASKLIGYFFINDTKFNFNAIAFGRIGGHNISVKISKSNYNLIRKNGMDPELILLTVQRKLIEGEMTIENRKRDSDTS
ncbi:MAG: hypothetical protein M3162_06415 [Thermoproteota archaeon]|nr:hypothetical protein [Thermoproteota archaeon]